MHMPPDIWSTCCYPLCFSSLQTEIAKRLNAICAQVIPFLSQEHQQQVAAAVERAKQVTTSELHAIIGVRKYLLGVYMVMVVTRECVCVCTYIS